MISKSESPLCNDWYRKYALRGVQFLIIYEALLVCPLALGSLISRSLYDVFGIHWWLLPGVIVVLIAATVPLFYGQLCRKTEAICQEVSKMNMLGNIASGVGHSLNNRFNSMLTLINMYYLKYGQRVNIEELSPGELGTRYLELLFLLEEIKRESVLGFTVAAAISKFAGQPIKPQAFHLEEAVSSAIKPLSYKRDFDKIMVIEKYAKPGPKLWASFSNIQDVIFHLAYNAYDALLEKENYIKEGKLYCPDFMPTITIYADLKKHGATITVSDNGIGMSKQVLAKIGRPFFSTKNNNTGHIGLGVWLIKRHLKMNVSNMTVRSSYTKGTSISFTLPYSR